MSRRGIQMLAIGLLTLLAAVALVQIHQIRRPLLDGPYGPVLTDPDSYIRWHLVHRALGDDGVRIRWIDADNAPVGRMNEWTAPTTIVGVLMVKLIQAVGGVDAAQAETVAAQWMGPVLGCLTILMLGWLGWRTGGWVVAACWLIVWPALRQVLYVTAFGTTDHHALHQLVMVGMVGGCLAWAKRPTIWGGVFVGAMSGLGLWSGGSELLPAWLCVAALGAHECGVGTHGDDTRPEFWRAWWITGGVVTAAAWWFEFWPELFHPRLELLSFWHVSAWLVAGGVLEAYRCRAWSLRRRWFIALGGLLALLVLAGALRRFDWAAMHVYQDERFQWQLTVTREFQSWFVDGSAAAVSRLWRGYGLLPLVAAALAFKFKEYRPRTRWVLASLGLWFLLSVKQIRWETLMVVPLVLGVGLALTEWLGSRRRHWLAPIICLVAALPTWLLVQQIRAETQEFHGQPEVGPYGTTFGLQAVARCVSSSASTNNIILAPWDQSGVLAGLGGVRVVGTGYWSNLDGLFDSYHLLTTASAKEFETLVRRRGVNWLVVRRPDQFGTDIAFAFVALHGRIPSPAEIEGTVVWRLAESSRQPRLDCPELKDMAPEWRIIKLL